MDNSRRSFIKISALGASGIAFTTTALSAIPSDITSNVAKNKKMGAALKRSATYCEVCFWKCAAWVYSDEKDNIQKIIGNENDPHCYGRLCPRGTGGVGMYSDTDRLKTPLIRTKIDGKDSFKEASWEEALDLVAKNMEKIKTQYGPESMALIKHGSPGSHLEHLFKAYGSDTIAEPAYAQCRGPREAGFGLTFGSWVGSPEPTDIRDTKCLVLIGSHIGENMHNSQVQEMSDAIDNGATIITVDPRCSTAASKSQHWLAIKPATDIALLLSWMHVLIYEDLYNKDYVEKYGSGFEALKKHVKPFSPEWAYGITTIKPKDIHNTARVMAAAAPSTIVHPGRHVTWYGDDSQRERAIAIINGLLGSWGNRGGFYFKEKISVPKFPHPPYPHPKWGWKELVKKYPFAEMGSTMEVIKASIPGADQNYPIKGWFVAGTNLVASVPKREVIEQAIQSLDFMVVMDTMPMEITGYADVILPECTYLERYDGIRSATNREPSIALRSPAAPPKYDSKPAWWMAKEIGNRLGLADYFNYNDYEEVIDWQLKEMGSSLEEMKKIGVKNFKRKSGALYMQKGTTHEFPTPSGKIEFYSEELASHGLDPIPVYTPHDSPRQGFYRLNYGRSPMHTFSRTINNPNLSDLTNENLLWVNPKVARIEGLKNNQKVWLQNQDGINSSFPIKVRVTERIRWDSVYMYHGFGHANKKLSRAHGKGISDTELISRISIDPIMGGTGMRGNFVKILLDNPSKETIL